MGEEEGPELKKQKVEEEPAVEEEEEEEASHESDDSSTEDPAICGFYGRDIERDPVLRERYRLYEEIVGKSDGFDTVKLPPRMHFGGIFKMDDYDSDPGLTEDMEGCAKFAVEEYNKGRTKPCRKLSAEKEEGDLEFVRVIRANYAVCAGFKFYITFEAVDTLSGKASVFQAKVYHGPDVKKVLIFRLKS